MTFATLDSVLRILGTRQGSMKILGTFLRPSFSSLTPFRPRHNAAQAFKNFGTALRSLEKHNIARTERHGLRVPRSGCGGSQSVRCLGTSSAAVSDVVEEDSSLHEGEPDGQWPRLTKTGGIRKSSREFHDEFRTVGRGNTASEDVRVCARIWGFRIAGNKLAFVDLMQDGVKLQVLCNFQDLEPRGVHPMAFKRWVDGLKRGDVISVTGRPHRTQRNELSIVASELPLLLSSCLRTLPVDLKNKEAKMRLRHVDLLIRPSAVRILKLGSEIKKFLRDYLEREDHISVKTPILAAAAGGAIAQPFTIPSSESRNIALRIAPELWLKRLIIGGFERIYEIGPCFRDEGYDNTHNPEFETCEFYRTYADLEELIKTTETMFHQMSLAINVLEYVDLKPPYKRLDFIPFLQAEMGCVLPKLDDPAIDPVPMLIQMMEERSVSIPAQPTLPHLLDRLCSHYIEPQCQDPTWIIHPPECVSPLSKSFTHEETGQTVAARAELFVRGQEIVNTYEEENSPIAQRRKFRRQLELNHAENIDEKLDESYLHALEFGMPPTGGWGCGIERLTMLFGGATRIADTLSFGTLKNVMGLGSQKRTAIQSGKGNFQENLDFWLKKPLETGEEK